jgi:hypothetical protein
MERMGRRRLPLLEQPLDADLPVAYSSAQGSGVVLEQEWFDASMLGSDRTL